MNLGLFISIRDAKTGKVEKEFEANSLVNAFIGVFCSQMMAGLTSTFNVKDTGGTNRNLSVATGSSYFHSPRISDAGVGVTTYGIVVGSSSTAVDVNDYALGTQIAHGTGSGQLSYGAMGINDAFTISGGDAYFSAIRTFTNGSGGDVTINELGLIIRTFNYGYYMLVDRTLSTTTISNGAAKVITYTFKATV